MFPIEVPSPRPASPATAPRPTAWLLERFDSGMGLVAQFAGAAVVVLMGTVTAVVLYQAFDLTRLAIFFLGSVIVSALLFGTRAAVLSALLAFVAYNFSLVEPRFSFRFAGPDDALTLAAFLVVALLVGGLAGRVRESERSNRRRADLLGALLNASRAFSAAAAADPLRRELALELEQASGGEAWVIAADADLDPLEPAARELAALADATASLVSEGAWRAKALVPGDACGVAVWRIGETPAAELAAQDRLCGLLVELAGAALERIRLVDLQAEAQTRERGSRLRDAILGSISHDLRTPLSTVLASASSLRDYGERFDAETRRNLADGVVQEAGRLDAYLESLLALSRIEAGQVAPRMRAVTILEVIDAAVGRLPSGAAGRVSVGATPEGLEAAADPALLEQIVFNLIDNAIVHGGPSANVEVTALETGDGVLLVVEDDGVGVAEDEYEQLAEKFYRGRLRSPEARGTGVGLSVASGLAAAMGGRLRFGRSQSASQGLRAELALLTREAACR